MILVNVKPPISFILLLPLLQTSLGEDQFNECPEDIFEHAPPCRSPGTYIANIDGEICKTKVDSTNNDCPTGSQMGLDARRRKLKILPGCKLNGGSTIEPVPNAEDSCFSYRLPVCDDGRHTLMFWTVGGTDFKQTKCYDIKINGAKASAVLYLSYLEANTCPRTEVAVYLKVENMQSELLIGKSQRIPLTDDEFSLSICFNNCGNESGSLKIQTLAMVHESGEGDPEKPCTIGRKKPNCQHYNGTIPSQCWSHGCQYYLNGKPRCYKGRMSCEPKSYSKCVCSNTFCKKVDNAAADCRPDPPIFENKLICRRANTYYVYHPKQHCYNEKDSGDCTATVIHAVNFNGPALTDQRGISYTAEKDSGYSDPHNLRLGIKQCMSIAGVNHKDTIELYTTAIVGNHIKSRIKPYRILAQGKCVTYPVPICQNGEYMLTIKLIEDFIVNPKAKCTDVRINNVPIMIHLDPFILSGNKRCETADAVVMFVAEGENEHNPKSDRTLHFKGHDEPIRVVGGVMELQFCYGYYCYMNHFVASAFSLERLGTGTNVCKLNSR